MKLHQVLERARAHIAGGWAPNISRDASGGLCGPDDEGIAKFCIIDALLVAAGGDLVAMHAGARSLGRRLEPSLLGDWEAAPQRTHADVLQLFARAHATALAQETP